ncbi:MAG: sulfatase activating formylglycine-generating enzyme, partial [Myxococcota bacterium]
KERVLVPAGAFWMGCDHPAHTYCIAQTQPYHQVYLDSYWIGRTEVTVEEWYQCIDDAVCPEQWLPEEEPLPAWADYHALGLLNFPITGVSWDLAQTYCDWIGGRLPTDAEWEKAAAGGCSGTKDECSALKRDFPWGNQAPNCDLANGPGIHYCTPNWIAWPADGPVAGRSPYGALNMAGNVREWVSDWFAADYYCSGNNADDFVIGSPHCTLDTPPDRVNPKGPPTGEQRTIRGGHSLDSLNDLLVHIRSPAPQPPSPNRQGFRCVWEVAP